MESPAIAEEVVAATVERRVHDSLELLGEMYAYNHWFYARLRPFLRGTVCDVGCGTGTFIQFLLGHKRVVGIDPCGSSVAVARHRFRDHRNVEVLQARLADCPTRDVSAGSFDTIIALRLLDCLDDDIGALRRMARLCRPGGRIVVLASAHMSAYGHLDRSVGHRRRYNRRMLSRAFAAAGLAVIHTAYMNALGYFGWLWHSRVLRRKQIPAGGARLLNRLVPFMDVFERLVRPPFGQSIVMVGAPAPASSAPPPAGDPHN